MRTCFFSGYIFCMLLGIGCQWVGAMHMPEQMSRGRQDVRTALGMLVLSGDLGRDHYRTLFPSIGKIRTTQQVVSQSRILVEAYQSIGEIVEKVLPPSHTSLDALSSVRIFLSDGDLGKRRGELPGIIKNLATFWLERVGECKKRITSLDQGSVCESPFYRAQTIYESIDRLVNEGLLDLQKSVEDQRLYGIVTQRPAFIEYVLAREQRDLFNVFVEYLDGDTKSQNVGAQKLVKELRDFLERDGRMLTYVPGLVVARSDPQNCWAVPADHVILTSYKLHALAVGGEKKTKDTRRTSNLTMETNFPPRGSSDLDVPQTPPIPIPKSPFKKVLRDEQTVLIPTQGNLKSGKTVQKNLCALDKSEQ